MTANSPGAAVASSRLRLLIAACLALFGIFLDNTIVNVALPAIQQSLSTASDQLEWIVNSYVVVFAGLVLLGGKLGDRFGRHRLFSLGLLLFAAASAFGALASTDTALIAARTVQGVGAALLAPLSLSLLATAFPRDKLPAALGLWAGVSGLGLAIGPLVGGLLVEHAGWHAVFWINVPIALGAAALTAPELGASRGDRRSRIDAIGAPLVTVGLIAMVAGLVRGVHHAWTSGPSVVLLSIGATLLAAFVVQQRHSAAPLLPLSALRDRRFRAAIAVLVMASFALLGTIWFLTLYLQNVAGYSAVAAGVRTLPLTMTTLFVAPIAGKVSATRGPRPVLILGLFLALGSLVALTQFHPDTQYGYLAGALAALGVGLAMVLPTCVSIVVDRVDPEEIGVISGAATMARQMGGALGLAVLATLGSRVATASFHQSIAAPNAFDDLVTGGRVRSLGHLAGEQMQAAATNAFLHGFTTVMWAAAGAVALALGAALSLPNRSPRATDGTADQVSHPAASTQPAASSG
jgi:EmrB/QacA subfamily drug resistance transporter